MAVCKCQNCGRIMDSRDYEANKIEHPSKGYIFVCDNCTTYKVNSYHLEMERAGKPKKNGLTYSIEWEQGRRTIESNILYTYGLVPGRDGTASVEWHTPVYEGLSGMAKRLATWEKFCLSSIGENGQHLNIGRKEMDGNPHIVYLIQEQLHNLFDELTASMAQHSNRRKVKAIFGRTMDDEWCQDLRFHSAENKYNWINTQHTKWLEYRICKFRTAEQYMRAIKFCTFITNTVIDNMSKVLNQPRYKQAHRARVISGKLVREWNKLEGEW
jgi:hypothetical protein